MKNYSLLIPIWGAMINILICVHSFAQAPPKVAIWPLRVVDDEQIYDPISIALENTLTELATEGKYEVYLRKNFSDIELVWVNELSKLYDGATESEKKKKALEFLRTKISVVDIYFFYEISEQKVHNRVEYILYVTVGRRSEPPDKISAGKTEQFKEDEVRKIEKLKNKIRKKITHTLLEKLELAEERRYPLWYKPDRTTFVFAGLSAIAWSATIYYDKTVVANFAPVSLEAYQQANSSAIAELERIKIETEIAEWDKAIGRRKLLRWVSGSLTVAALTWHIWLNNNKPGKLNKNDSRIGVEYQEEIKVQVNVIKHPICALQGVQIRLSVQF